MQAARLLKPVCSTLGFVAFLTALTSAHVQAASNDTRKPVILDSQGGINDGQSGTMLQTAPLSRQPIIEAQPIASPAGLVPAQSTPIVVAPYIQYPTGGTQSQPSPQPYPQPVVRSR